MSFSMQHAELEKTETQRDESHINQSSYMTKKDEKTSRNFEHLVRLLEVSYLLQETFL